MEKVEEVMEAEEEAQVRLREYLGIHQPYLTELSQLGGERCVPFLSRGFFGYHTYISVSYSKHPDLMCSRSRSGQRFP